MTDAQRLVAYQALLHDIEELTGFGTQDEFFARVAERARVRAPADLLSVWMQDPGSQMLRQTVLSATALPELPLTEVPLDFGPGGHVFEQQQAQVGPLASGPASLLVVFLRQAGFRSLGIWPVSTATSRWGVLGVASRAADGFTPDIVATLERLAVVMARGLERCRPSERPVTGDVREAGPSGQAMMLLRLTNAITSVRSLPDLLKAISAELLKVLPHFYASLSLWDDEVQGLRRWAVVQPSGSGAIVAERALLTEDEPPYLAYKAGEVVVFSRGELEAYGAPVTLQLVAAGLRSGVCFPLQTTRGKYGVLNVGSTQDDAFPAGRIMVLWQIARQLAVAIENATYIEQTERYRVEASAQRDRFKLLLDINNALVSQLDPRALWSSILAAVRQAIDHDYASILIADPVSRELRVEVATYYDVRGVIEPQAAASLDRSAATLAIQWNSPCVFDGAELDQFDVAGLPSLRGAGLRSMCVVPLSGRGGVRGTLNIASRHPGRFSPTDIELLRDIAGQVALAIDNTLAFREISDLKNRLTEENQYLEAEITEQHDFKEIVGESSVLRNVLGEIRSVAATDSTVLLLGETGTGKELLARATHDLSRRRDRAFIRFNGASLPASLIESELFGYEKGAFTGAVQSKAGRLELANRGTFFFDEVGDVPIEVQPKLLRALQEREFERLGSTTTQRVDVRLIAATNRNLEEMVAGGSFRSDLFYRLSVFPIKVPPLRERREDIPALVRHFVQKLSRAMGRRITTVPPQTMDAFQEWHWPGNIRELQNVVERAIILSPGSSLVVPLGAIRSAAPVQATAAAAPSEARYQAGERALILEALRESKGVIAGPNGAAARLGIKRTTLHSKMQRLGIKRPTF